MAPVIDLIHAGRVLSSTICYSLRVGVEAPLQSISPNMMSIITFDLRQGDRFAPVLLQRTFRLPPHLLCASACFWICQSMLGGPLCGKPGVDRMGGQKRAAIAIDWDGKRENMS